MARSGTPWLRLWDQMLDDPTVISMNSSTFSAFILALLHGNRQQPRGSFPSKLVVKRAVGMSDNMLDKLVGLGVLTADSTGVRITNWKKYQVDKPKEFNRTHKVGNGWDSGGNSGVIEVGKKCLDLDLDLEREGEGEGAARKASTTEMKELELMQELVDAAFDFSLNPITVTPADLKKWKMLYPNVPLARELVALHAWTHPENYNQMSDSARKARHPKTIRLTITNWFKKAQGWKEEAGLAGVPVAGKPEDKPGLDWFMELASRDAGYTKAEAQGDYDRELAAWERGER